MVVISWFINQLISDWETAHLTGGACFPRLPGWNLRFDASSEVWVLSREQGALGLDAEMGMEAFLGRGSQDDPSLGRNSHSSWFNATYIQATTNLVGPLVLPWLGILQTWLCTFFGAPEYRETPRWLVFIIFSDFVWLKTACLCVLTPHFVGSLPIFCWFHSDIAYSVGLNPQISSGTPQHFFVINSQMVVS